MPPALCQRHARPLEVPCDHCGDFSCAHCLHGLDEGRFCEACIGSGRVADWLARLRAQLTGRRDGWAWLVLIAVLVMLSVDLALRRGDLAGASTRTQLLVAAGCAAWVFAATTFWGGLRVGRIALLCAPTTRAVFEAVAVSGREPLLVLGEAIVGTVLAVLILVDTRNRLFFRLEVDDEDLRALAIDLSNTWARASVAVVLALWLAVPVLPTLQSRVMLSALFALAVVGLGFALIGLRRIDPAARPPIGGRSSALGGSALAAIWIALAFVLR